MISMIPTTTKCSRQSQSCRDKACLVRSVRPVCGAEGIATFTNFPFFPTFPKVASFPSIPSEHLEHLEQLERLDYLELTTDDSQDSQNSRFSHASPPSHPSPPRSPRPPSSPNHQRARSFVRENHVVVACRLLCEIIVASLPQNKDFVFRTERSELASGCLASCRPQGGARCPLGQNNPPHLNDFSRVARLSKNPTADLRDEKTFFARNLP
jgi:hypothetical protein